MYRDAHPTITLNTANGCEVYTVMAVFYANYVYGSFDMNVFAQVFTPLQTFQCGIFGKASGIASGWHHIDLGAGNHLLVRDCIYPEFEKRTRQMTPPEKFQSYLKICTELQDLHQ